MQLLDKLQQGLASQWCQFQRVSAVCVLVIIFETLRAIQSVVSDSVAHSLEFNQKSNNFSFLNDTSQ